MAVTAQAQSGVLGAAARIVLHCNACPVRSGASDYMRDAALSGTLGDSVIISSLEGFPSLCEQRGVDDPTVSRQGGEDRSVALLI